MYVCRSNKCIDPCTGVTCPGGQRCSVGKCVSCSRGEACGCSSPNVSSGSGSCFDPCNPNKCASSTPTCTRSGANYSCACTSTSCGAGKKCSGSSCTNCAANESCNCPSGQKANGSGGCATVACSSNSDCGAGKQCVNAGTTSAYCSHCTANSQCTCPSGQLANGSGSCVKPVCTDNTTCGAGRQCIDAGKYNAACDPCPSGTQCTCPSGQKANGSGGCGAVACSSDSDCGAGKQCADAGTISASCINCAANSSCTCPSGQVANGSGGCGVAGCAGALASARPDVAVAEDEAGLAVALVSGKQIIAVVKSFPSGTELNIGDKMLVGPKYFSAVSSCSAEATPTLSKNTETGAGIKLAGGVVSDLNIDYSYTKSGAAAISGYGNLKNISIKKGSNSYSTGIAVTGGTMSLDGKIDVATKSTGLSIASNASLSSKANVSLTGEGGYMTVAGTLKATAGSFTIKKEGSGTPLSVQGNASFSVPLVLEADGWLNAAIELGDRSTLSMNGNGNKITLGEGMAIKGGTATIGGTTSIVYTKCYSVFRNNSLTINGALTISTPCAYQPTRDSKSIFLLTGPSNAVKYYVNAPLTVTGGSLSLGYFEGGLLNLGANANVGGNIGGYSSWYDTKNYGSVLKVTSGARLKLGGTCKKATSTKDLDPYKSPNGFYLNHGSSGTWKVFEQLPNPPFAGSC